MAVTLDGTLFHSVIHDQTMAVFEIINILPVTNQPSVKQNKNSGGKHNLNKLNTLIGSGTVDLLCVLAVAANAGKVGDVAEDFASMKYNLPEILEDESVSQIAHDGVIIVVNDRYPFWEVTVSDNFCGIDLSNVCD